MVFGAAADQGKGEGRGLAEEAAEPVHAAAAEAGGACHPIHAIEKDEAVKQSNGLPFSSFPAFLARVLITLILLQQLGKAIIPHATYEQCAVIRWDAYKRRRRTDSIEWWEVLAAFSNQSVAPSDHAKTIDRLIDRCGTKSRNGMPPRRGFDWNTYAVTYSR